MCVSMLFYRDVKITYTSIVIGQLIHSLLQVNFLPEIIQLSKEVRNLKNLGFRVPLAIVNKVNKHIKRK